MGLRTCQSVQWLSLLTESKGVIQWSTASPTDKQLRRTALGRRARVATAPVSWTMIGINALIGIGVGIGIGIGIGIVQLCVPRAMRPLVCTGTRRTHTPHPTSARLIPLPRLSASELLLAQGPKLAHRRTTEWHGVQDRSRMLAWAFTLMVLMGNVPVASHRSRPTSWARGGCWWCMASHCVGSWSRCWWRSSQVGPRVGYQGCADMRTGAFRVWRGVNRTAAKANQNSPPG